MRKGTYIASRASIPERSLAWRNLRKDGYLIISSWIDEVNATDLCLLWSKIEQEINSAERLVIYVESEDFPLKGTLIEVGMALANKIPVYLVAPKVEIDPKSFRPLGSWINHKLVKVVNSMDEALKGSDKF